MQVNFDNLRQNLLQSFQEVCRVTDFENMSNSDQERWQELANYINALLSLYDDNDELCNDLSAYGITLPYQ